MGEYVKKGKWKYGEKFNRTYFRIVKEETCGLKHTYIRVYVYVLIYDLFLKHWK